jgi:hypothetical protein
LLSDWVSFLAYPNLFGIKGFVVVEKNKKFSNSTHIDKNCGDTGL